jgi:hypothetical protein
MSLIEKQGFVKLRNIKSIEEEAKKKIEDAQQNYEKKLRCGNN